MRRRRGGGWLYLAVLPLMVLAQSGYDAQPIGRPAQPSRPIARGYQPPPIPMLFESPRSQYKYPSQFHSFRQPSGNGFVDNFQRPPQVIERLEQPFPPQSQLQNQNSQYAHYAPNIEQWNRPGYPRPQLTAPQRFVYTPEIISPVIGPPSSRPRDDIAARPRITQENPPDVLNNIIVHIYLNAKGRQIHTTATSGPIKGLFGIGTSHGGPGTHSNPIVITKDFDRDTLEFVEEGKAQQMVEEGPANIVEVKATVSSPDRSIEHSLNKAVNTELTRAIPVVMNRMQGPMRNVDNELRKELEQALVDEIAKNLGDTIDQMSSANIEDEDLGKLIEEGFSEIEKELASGTSTTSTFTTKTTTQPTTTTRRTTTTARRTTSTVDEMMEESPFDKTFHRETTLKQTPPTRTTTTAPTTTTSPRTLPPFHRETTLKQTPPPRTTTTTRTTTTSPRTTTTTRATTTSPRTVATTRESTVEWWITSTPATSSTTRQMITVSTTQTTPWWMATSPSTTTTRPTMTTTRPTTTGPWWISTTPVSPTTTRRLATIKPEAWTTPWWMITSTPSPSTSNRPTMSTTRSTTMITTRPTTAEPWWMSTSTPAAATTTRSTTTTEAPMTTPWWMSTALPTVAATRPTATTPWWMTTAPPVAVTTTRPTIATPESWTTPWWMTAPSSTISSVRTTSTTTRPTTTTTPPRTTVSLETTTSTRPATTTTRPVTIATHPTTTTATTVTAQAPTTEFSIAPPTTTEQTTTLPHWRPPATTTTRTTEQSTVIFTTTSAPDQWRTTEVTFKTVSLQEGATTEAGWTHKAEVGQTRVPAAVTTKKPSTFAEQNMINRQPQFPPTRWPGHAEPSSKEVATPKQQEGEPRIVTSRPVHVISLDEGPESSTKTTTSRGTTMGRRKTSTAPHTTIESARTTTTTALRTASLTSSTVAYAAFTPSTSFTTGRPVGLTSTTQSGEALTTKITEYPSLPEDLEEEEEQTEEGKGRVVMKERPSTFGDQNLAKPEFEVGPEEGPETAETTISPPLPSESAYTRPREFSSAASFPPFEATSPTFEPSPFEVGPGMFEESTRATVAYREPLKTTEYTTQMTTPHPETVAVQPVPDTFFIPREPCPTPNDPSDTNRTDVLFLLDSSNSFNGHKFMHAIQLILDTVSQFRNIGPNGTQVSLVQYNSEPYLEFSLRKHICKQWLIDDIADTDYMQGGSMLGKAVEKVSRFAFTKNRGDRPDAENVLVILTDGQSDDRIQEPVEVAKKHNLTVLVIATLEANPQYLMDLAGNMNNVFQLHTDIKNTLPHKLAERINSIQTEFSPSDTFEVKDSHGMITIALPTEEEEKQEQEEEKPEPREEVPASVPVPIVPTVSTPSSISVDVHGLVHLQCSPLGFKISLNVPAGYEGVAVVKGQEDNEECRKDIRALESSTNLTVGFFVASKSCGVTRVHSVEPPGNNYTLILHLKHRVPLVTGGDRAYLLQCYIGKPSHDLDLSADLAVTKGELMIAETISLLSVPPTCSYSIRKDSPNGTIVKNAFIGQTVYHRWECDGGEEANNVYGIHIHSCFASDDVDKRFPIVDGRGCSSDLTLLSDPRYSEDSLTAYAESKAFAFTEADQLKFVCKLSLCTRDGDGCEGVTPPACGGNSPEQLVIRRIRHQSSAMEGALSSALSTKVGVAANMPSTFKGRVADLLSSGGTWILLALLAAIATVGTVVLSRYALSSTDATTTCSDPETMTSPPTSPFPLFYSSPSSPTSPIPIVHSPPSSVCSPIPARPAAPEELITTTIDEDQPTSEDSGQSSDEVAPPSEEPANPQPSPDRRPSRAEMNQRLAAFLKDFDRSKYV